MPLQRIIETLHEHALGVKTTRKLKLQTSDVSMIFDFFFFFVITDSFVSLG